VLDFEWIFYKIKPRKGPVPTELHITPEKPGTGYLKNKLLWAWTISL